MKLQNQVENLSIDNISMWSFGISLLITILILGSVWVSYQYLPDQIPLYYSLPWGDRQLATLNQFIVLPALSFAIIIINSLISWQLHKSQYILKRVIAASTLIFSILFFIATLKIIYIFI